MNYSNVNYININFFILNKIINKINYLFFYCINMTNTLSYENKKYLKQFNITKYFKIFNYIKINKLFCLRATKSPR